MRTWHPLLCVTLLVTPANPVLAQEPERVDCDKDLKKAYELIDARWSFLVFKPGYVDLQAVYEELEPEAKDTELPHECADIVSRFMASLGDGHSRLYSYPDVKYTSPAIRLRTLRERLSRTPGQPPTPHVYVTARDTTNDTLTNILPGSEILAVDGQPVESLHQYWSERVTGSTSQWRDYMCDRQLLRGPYDEPVELKLRTPSRRVKTVVVPRRPWRRDEDDEERERRYRLWRDTVTIAVSRRLEGGWGYLQLTTFSFDSLVRRFDQALDSIRDVNGLIIDLRGNGGGSVGAFLAISGRFIDQREILSYYQVRQPGKYGVYEMYDQKTGDAVFKMPLRAEPREPIYRGALVLLVDRSCFSACEYFSGGLQAIGRATVVGPEPSGGGSGAVGGLKLPSGARISFSWWVGWLPNGRQIEGNGVRPNIEVRLRARDFATGRDRTLERAIKALQNGEVAPALIATGEEG